MSAQTGRTDVGGEPVTSDILGSSRRDDTPYQCQGCGTVRYGSHWRDRGHACWRNEDGTYEEGGTFQ